MGAVAFMVKNIVRADIMTGKQQLSKECCDDNNRDA